jgi:hypothetical protein
MDLIACARTMKLGTMEEDGAPARTSLSLRAWLGNTPFIWNIKQTMAAIYERETQKRKRLMPSVGLIWVILHSLCYSFFFLFV